MKEGVGHCFHFASVTLLNVSTFPSNDFLEYTESKQLYRFVVTKISKPLFFTVL